LPPRSRRRFCRCFCSRKSRSRVRIRRGGISVDRHPEAARPTTTPIQRLRPGAKMRKPRAQLVTKARRSKVRDPNYLASLWRQGMARHLARGALVLGTLAGIRRKDSGSSGDCVHLRQGQFPDRALRLLSRLFHKVTGTVHILRLRSAGRLVRIGGRMRSIGYGWGTLFIHSPPRLINVKFADPPHRCAGGGGK
jgi:hypothetical protein